MFYAYGGALPQHREWVRHDLTDAGWRWRVWWRALAQAFPFVLVFALLPGPSYLHVLLPAFVLLTSGFTTAIFAEELRNRRLRQHGFDPPSVTGDRTPP